MRHAACFQLMGELVKYDYKHITLSASQTGMPCRMNIWQTVLLPMPALGSSRRLPTLGL